MTANVFITMKERTNWTKAIQIKNLDGNIECDVVSDRLDVAENIVKEISCVGEKITRKCCKHLFSRIDIVCGDT